MSVVLGFGFRILEKTINTVCQNMVSIAWVVTKFLKRFFDATKTLFTSLHVTSNCYFDEIFKIETVLNDWCKSNDLSLCLMA